MYTLQQIWKTFFKKIGSKILGRKRKSFSKKNGTYILAEVLKNKFLWQSDHGLCHQTTVYRPRKFAKNLENTYVLGHTPMGAIIYGTLPVDKMTFGNVLISRRVDLLE